MLLVLTLQICCLLAASIVTLTDAFVEISRFREQLDSAMTAITRASAGRATVLHAAKTWTPAFIESAHMLGKSHRSAGRQDKMAIELNAPKVLESVRHLTSLATFLEKNVEKRHVSDAADLVKFVTFVVDFVQTVDEYSLYRNLPGYTTPRETFMVLSSICEAVYTSKSKKLKNRIENWLNPRVSTRSSNHEPMRQYMYSQLGVDVFFGSASAVRKGLEKKIVQIPEMCGSSRKLEQAASLYEIAAWLLEWKTPRLNSADVGEAESRLFEKLKQDLRYADSLIAGALRLSGPQDYLAATTPSQTLSKLCNKQQISEIAKSSGLAYEKPVTSMFVALWSILARFQHHSESQGLSSLVPTPYTVKYVLKRSEPLSLYKPKASPMDSDAHKDRATFDDQPRRKTDSHAYKIRSGPEHSGINPNMVVEHENVSESTASTESPERKTDHDLRRQPSEIDGAANTLGSDANPDWVEYTEQFERSDLAKKTAPIVSRRSSHHARHTGVLDDNWDEDGKIPITKSQLHDEELHDDLYDWSRVSQAPASIDYDADAEDLPEITKDSHGKKHTARDLASKRREAKMQGESQDKKFSGHHADDFTDTDWFEYLSRELAQQPLAARTPKPLGGRKSLKR